MQDLQRASPGELRLALRSSWMKAKQTSSSICKILYQPASPNHMLVVLRDLELIFPCQEGSHQSSPLILEVSRILEELEVQSGRLLVSHI